MALAEIFGGAAWGILFPWGVVGRRSALGKIKIFGGKPSVSGEFWGPEMSGMKVRVLFGTAGWPSGVLEVGSWAVAQGMAEVVIRQIHPSYLFSMAAEAAGSLEPGKVPSWVLARLEEHRAKLCADLELRQIAGGWVLVDGKEEVHFYIICSLGAVFDARWLAWPQCREAVRWYEQRTGQKGRFLRQEGSELSGESISPVLWEALGAVGGEFLDRLIRFRPHVIGFRVEGGDQEQVAGWIRACRLFCQAEIILGGPTATSHPVEVLEDLGADYVFSGEAEETFVQFLRLAQFPDSRPLAAQIPGLAYQYGGRSFHNTLPADGYGRTAAEQIGSENLLWVDRLVDPAETHPDQPETLSEKTTPRPLPLGKHSYPEIFFSSASRTDRLAWRNRVRPVVSSGLLEANRLNWSLLEGFDRPTSSLFFTGSRGCPGGCSFCAKLHGSQVRWKSAARLLEEIQEADLCVEAGRLMVQRWPLFAHTDRPDLQNLLVAWAAVYDEDFFLLRDRAVEFFQLWDRTELKYRYRLSFQTNPRSLLDGSGQVDKELLEWIDRLKPMIQLGGESFHPELLARWRKRHTVEQLLQVADALESTHQDYTVFILLSDFDSTPEEVVDGVWLLCRSALPRRGMRIASSPFTIPLYDSQTRRDLEYRGLLPPGKVRSYRDYERPQPGWMNPWAARLADLADAELHFALQPAHREAALVRAMEVLVETIRQWAERPQEAWAGPAPCQLPSAGRASAAFAQNLSGSRPWGQPAQQFRMDRRRCSLLLQQAEWALEQIREWAYQPPPRSKLPS